MTRIGVLGAGSWGTALAVYAAGIGYPVTLWARRKEAAAALRESRENARYLPGVSLPEGIETTAELDALADCHFVIAAVPSHGFREVLRSFLAALPAGRPVSLVSATKGVEAATLARMSQVSLEEAVAADRELSFAILSGPSFAQELATGTPTAAVIAAEEGELARRLQQLFSTDSLRLYTSGDVVGVELGGTAKNVIAIAAGVVSGLGYGHNTLAALITRGLHEISRLGLAYGGQRRTFAGLAGLGDLVLTCTGGLSRNRRAGLALAEGRSLAELEATTGMVAEGVRNAATLAELARRKGVEMPITEQMVAVIRDGKSPRAAVLELMSRELKSEAEI